MNRKIVTRTEFLAGHYGYLTLDDFSVLLGISIKTLDTWAQTSDTCPKPIREDGLKLVEPVNTLRWVSRRPMQTKGAPILQRAAKALRDFMAANKTPDLIPKDDLPSSVANPYRHDSKYGAVNNPQAAKRIKSHIKVADEEPPETPEPPQKPVEVPHAIPPKVDPDEGIKPALKRLRKAEVYLAAKFNEQVACDDPTAPQTFRMWKDCMDQLRRLEGEIQDILKAEGSAMPVEEVKRAVGAIVSAVVGRLKLFPSQIAHELADRDAADIRQILESHIHSVLDGLSKTCISMKMTQNTPEKEQENAQKTP